MTQMNGGLLDQATADKVVPKIFFSNTSYEYWGRVAALIHISADGKRDASISDNVRIYHFTGLQHFPGPFPPQRGTEDLLGQEPESPLPIKYFWRAMITNMDAWVRSDTFRRQAATQRLQTEHWWRSTNTRSPRCLASTGRMKQTRRIASILVLTGGREPSVQPPKVGPAFPVLVSQVDSDGNERDGVRLPEITVPLATYTGWNLRDPSIGAPDQRVAFEASYLPFPKTAGEREKTGDPRKSIAERYADREDYLAGMRRRWTIW